MQHLFGTAPDETGRLISNWENRIPEQLLGNPSGDLPEDIERMKQAEQALAEWQAKLKLSKAMSSKGQPRLDYRPGDLVHVWRKQISGQCSGKNGRFVGPARILVTETKRDTNGELRKGSAVWGEDEDPEQLRPAPGHQVAKSFWKIVVENQKLHGHFLESFRNWEEMNIKTYQEKCLPKTTGIKPKIPWKWNHLCEDTGERDHQAVNQHNLQGVSGGERRALPLTWILMIMQNFGVTWYPLKIMKTEVEHIIGMTRLCPLTLPLIFLTVKEV